MKKAEERAWEAYPSESHWFNENRAAFIKGYQQAIEDLLKDDKLCASLKWRFAFNAATEEGKGAPKELLKLSRSKEELIWIEKGEYSAYTLYVHELKKLPKIR